jgi:hypothetical protein
LADFSIKNNDGYTPSRLAFLGGHLEAVQVMRTLQSEDEGEHMAKRSLAEAARQVKSHIRSHFYFTFIFTAILFFISYYYYYYCYDFTYSSARWYE